jgi:hypothetical protein
MRTVAAIASYTSAKSSDGIDIAEFGDFALMGRRLL